MTIGLSLVVALPESEQMRHEDCPRFHQRAGTTPKSMFAKDCGRGGRVSS